MGSRGPRRVWCLPQVGQGMKPLRRASGQSYRSIISVRPKSVTTLKTPTSKVFWHVILKKNIQWTQAQKQRSDIGSITSHLEVIFFGWVTNRCTIFHDGYIAHTLTDREYTLQTSSWHSMFWFPSLQEHVRLRVSQPQQRRNGWHIWRKPYCTSAAMHSGRV